MDIYSYGVWGGGGTPQQTAHPGILYNMSRLNSHAIPETSCRSHTVICRIIFLLVLFPSTIKSFYSSQVQGGWYIILITPRTYAIEFKLNECLRIGIFSVVDWPFSVCKDLKVSSPIDANRSFVCTLSFVCYYNPLV